MRGTNALGAEAKVLMTREKKSYREAIKCIREGNMRGYLEWMEQYRIIHKEFKKEVARERSRTGLEKVMARGEWSMSRCWETYRRIKRAGNREQITLTTGECDRIQSW